MISFFLISENKTFNCCSCSAPFFMPYLFRLSLAFSLLVFLPLLLLAFCFLRSVTLTLAAWAPLAKGNRVSGLFLFQFRLLRKLRVGLLFYRFVIIFLRVSVMSHYLNNYTLRLKSIRPFAVYSYKFMNFDRSKKCIEINENSPILLNRLKYVGYHSSRDLGPKFSAL